MNIVTLGGGTGQFALLQAIRELKNLNITAIVSMADSGGSSGRLRDELGALPPGDILKALLALSTLPGDVARKILLHRFSSGILNGHTAGNMLLTMLSQYSGNFMQAINALGELLEIRGKVLPITIGHITLKVKLENRQNIIGENNINIPLSPNRSRVTKVWLEPNALALGESLRSIKTAKLVIISPGDLFTSIIPVLLVHGVKETIQESKAKFIYICNAMTKSGETDGFRVSDFIRVIEQYTGRKMDIVICNNTLPDKKVLSYYAKEFSYPVVSDMKVNSRKRKIIASNLIMQGRLARHNPQKIAAIITAIVRTIKLEKISKT